MVTVYITYQSKNGPEDERQSRTCILSYNEHGKGRRQQQQQQTAAAAMIMKTAAAAAAAEAAAAEITTTSFSECRNRLRKNR